METKKRTYDLEFKLKVVEYSKSHATEATAREFGIDSRRVRHWKSQETELAWLLNASRETGISKPRLRLKGAGRQARRTRPPAKAKMLMKVEVEEPSFVDEPSQESCSSTVDEKREKRSARQRYEPGFKAKIVNLAEKVGNRQAGRRFDISESNVRRWRDEMASHTTTTAAEEDCPSKRSAISTNCANCNLIYNEAETNAQPLTEFTATDTGTGEERQVSISEAINVIFEAGLKLNRKSTSESTNLTMCYQCISFLAELFKFFMEFMELTKYESAFQKLISRSVIWNFEKSKSKSRVSQENEDEPFDPYAVDIKIETEDCASDKGDLDNDELFEPNENHSNSSGSDEEDDRDYSSHLVGRAVNPLSEPTVVTRSMRSGVKSVPRQKPKLHSSKRHSPKPKKSHLKIGRSSSRSLKPKKKLTHKCTKCSKTFKDSQTLSTHVSNMHLMTRHSCTQCEKSFKDKKLLTRHLNYKHGQAPTHPCPKCTKSFEMPYQLKNHLLVTHAPPVVCPLCSVTLPNESFLRSHYQNEHPTETLDFPPLVLPKCVHCSVEFQTRQLLKSHILAEHPSARFQCPQCPKTFKAGKLYRRHLKYKHGDGSEKVSLHRCTMCPKSFPIPSQLASHVKAVHAEENKFPCPQCDKMFPVENYVQNHIRRCHTVNTTQYKCEQCDKVYSSASGYQIHVDTKHLDKKDFVCETCGKRFVRPDWLRNHMTTHDTTRTREFSCSHCDLTFYTRSCRNNHLKTHSNLKQHLCSYCGTEFLHAVSLRRHIQVRHCDEVEGAVVERHECQQCGKVFKLREYLLQHLRSKTHGGPGHTAEKRKNKAREQMKFDEPEPDEPEPEPEPNEPDDTSSVTTVEAEVIGIEVYRSILPTSSSVVTSWYQPFYPDQ